MAEKVPDVPTSQQKRVRQAAAALTGNIHLFPEIEFDAKHAKIANVTHQLFLSYKTDELGRFTDEELDRFRINFSRCVIGMEPKIAYDPDTSFKGLCK